MRTHQRPPCSALGPLEKRTPSLLFQRPRQADGVALRRQPANQPDGGWLPNRLNTPLSRMRVLCGEFPPTPKTVKHPRGFGFSARLPGHVTLAIYGSVPRQQAFASSSCPSTTGARLLIRTQAKLERTPAARPFGPAGFLCLRHEFRLSKIGRSDHRRHSG
jgi:hypothetical protein